MKCCHVMLARYGEVPCIDVMLESLAMPYFLNDPSGARLSIHYNDHAKEWLYERYADKSTMLLTISVEGHTTRRWLTAITSIIPNDTTLVFTLSGNGNDLANDFQQGAPMASETRAYKVVNTSLLDSHPPRIVEARNSFAAIRHVTAPYEAFALSALELIDLQTRFGADLVIEKAGE